MRILLAAAIALFLAAPAAAQGPDLFEQYRAASAAFLGNAESPGDFQENEPVRILDGLEGDWFPIGLMLPQSNDTAIFATACEKLPSRVVLRNSYSFDLTLRSGEDDEVTTTYSSRGGNVFGSYADPAAWLHRLGLDREGAPSGAILAALKSINGIATVHRPSPDILVIQTDYGPPQLLGRCP